MALNSLFTALSGLQAHQTKSSVVADNIANMNTTGFKARRASFEEMLAQTIKQSTGPETGISGTNPSQVGIGVRVKSIDTSFTQGSLQTTDQNTDLALEGAGFFVLSDGVNQYLTRDGSFSFDGTGRLVDPGTGMIVQGNMIPANGSLSTVAKDSLQSIQLDLSQEISGQATTRVNLSGNLDAGAVPTLTAGTEFGTAARVGGTAATLANVPTAITATTPGKLTIQLTKSDGTTPSGEIVLPSRTYSSLNDLVNEINVQIMGNEALRGLVLAQPAANAGGTAGAIQLRSTAGGQFVSSLSVTSANAALLTALGLPGTATAGTVASATSSLNDLAQVGFALNDGDKFIFTGTRNDGTSYQGSMTYNAASAGTVGSLLTAVQSAFGGGVTASLDSATGALVLTNLDGTNVTGFTMNLSLDDADVTATAPASGLVTPSSFATQKISTEIYDSEGRQRTLDVTLTQSPIANEWYYNATVDKIHPIEGSGGTVAFRSDGTVSSFNPSDGQGALLKVTLPGEIGTTSINLSGLQNIDRGITGLTQFNSSSTAGVVDQDGRQSGRLDSVFIDTKGTIKGRFTNGETVDVGRVIVANVNNPDGLQRAGGNLFTVTGNAGPLRKEIATETLETSINAGTLELSNVDLAQQLSELIIAQRGFQSNARVVTTSDEILQETVGLKR
jgi:flagellar hook protein FlgE